MCLINRDATFDVWHIQNSQGISDTIEYKIMYKIVNQYNLHILYMVGFCQYNVWPIVCIK